MSRACAKTADERRERKMINSMFLINKKDMTDGTKFSFENKLSPILSFSKITRHSNAEGRAK
jgi:hypothetical protein